MENLFDDSNPGENDIPVEKLNSVENWFYYSKDGYGGEHKLGPYDFKKLQELVKRGTIRSNTILEKETGQQYRADDVFDIRPSMWMWFSDVCVLVLFPMVWLLAVILMWACSNWEKRTKIFVTQYFAVPAGVYLVFSVCVALGLWGNNLSYDALTAFYAVTFLVAIFYNLVLPLYLVKVHPLWSAQTKMLAAIFAVLLGIVMLIMVGAMLWGNLNSYKTREDVWKDIRRQLNVDSPSERPKSEGIYTPRTYSSPTYSNPSQTDSRERYRSSFLNIFGAAQEGTVDDVRFFIAQGVDVNARFLGGVTLLHLAAKNNPNVDVLEYLIAQGGSVHTKNDGDATPLHFAAFKNTNVDILKYLVEQGADVNAKAEGDVTPLHSAAANTSNVDVLKYLIEQGANVNAKADEGVTPLHFAAMQNSNVDVLKYLVSQGGSISIKIDYNLTLLHLAARENPHVEVLEYLIAQGANVNAKADGGVMPLHMAAMLNSNVDVIKYLVAQGANVNAKTIDGETPLDVADTAEKQTILRRAGGRFGWQR